jgi:hypothetical protein
MFEWVVISFSLKNIGIKMSFIFHHMINHNSETYIDDIMVKSKSKSTLYNFLANKDA